ncbi:MAG: hypothetical protein H7A35_14260 [Planctomycetales bacterium]|nr:hypothetical protein [bacterium]UNM08000.1 MAG: hypothetical protein H7A35_14260 [Planctomycetales bacterium]
MTGKPGYDEARLQALTVAELRDRLSRIDNPTALAIATKLWQAMESLFTNQYGSSLMRDEYSTWQIAARNRHRLLRRLEALRRVDIGDFLAEGPQRMDMALQHLHPLVRLLRPAQKAKRSEDSADWLLRNLEFVEDPERQFPEGFVRSWIFGVGMFLTMALPVLLVLLLAPLLENKVVLLLPTFVILVTGILVSVLQLHGYSVVRIMAAYISFTDEFVNLDGEQGAESREQSDET